MPAFDYSEDIPTPHLRTIDDVLLRAQVEEFLNYEAELLDQWQYSVWLDLLEDDVKYIAPIRRNVQYGAWEREQTTPRRDLCWFDESKTTLGMRVAQLATGEHWAEEPLSRIVRTISNVRVLPSEGEDGEPSLVARAHFLLYRNRVDDDVSIVGGKVRWVLIEHGGEFRIAEKFILIEQSTLLMNNITFLL